MNHSHRINHVCLGFVAIALAARCVAHDQVPGEPQSGPIAITNVMIVRVDQPIIESGTVVFDSGIITAIGEDAEVPEAATTIDGSGKRVYPGLIESISNIGLVEISSVRATVDTDEVGDLNPNLRPWVAVNPDSELIPVARANGVLLASVAPDRGTVRGQVGLMQLDGWTYQDMMLGGPVGMMINGRTFASREEKAAKRADKVAENIRRLEDRLDKAKRYEMARRDDPDSQPIDIRLEAWLPVLNGELPIIIDADRQYEIETAIAFAVKNDLRPIIYGGYDADRCADLLARTDVPVIIHATYRLPLRRDDAYDAPYTLPQRLQKAGVKFAIAGEGSGYPGGASNVRNLPYHAAVAVAYGLDVENAIRSITLSPAEIMGVDDKVGSITVGKHATLFIADGDILETPTKVTDAFVQGRRVDLGNRHRSLYEKYRQKYSETRSP